MNMQMALADGSDEPMIEINTTPAIDVMLVLLIIFIITVPIQTHAVKIDLPEGIPVTVDRLKNKIVIGKRGATSWNGRAVTLTSLNDAGVRAKRLPVAPELLMHWPHISGSTKSLRSPSALASRRWGS